MLEIFFDATRDGCDLAIASPAHHDDVVGVIDLASYIDDFDSCCLLIERCLGDLQSQLAADYLVVARRGTRVRFQLCAFCLFGQLVSSFTVTV
jgi:hypothetical protein